MFDHLGKLIARHWAWVLVVWVVGVAAVKLAAPPWASISQDDDIRSFPDSYPSVVGHYLLKKAFPSEFFDTYVVVGAERSDGPFSDADQQFLDTLAARLTQVQEGGVRRDADGNELENRYGLGEFLTPSSLGKGQLLMSKDQRAALLVAGCKFTFMAERLVGTVKALRGTIEQMRQRGEIPPGIQVAVTGDAGVGADLQISSDESLHRSFRVTILLVVVILLLVYRSPVVAMIPLVTIGVSVVTAMSLMSLLTLVPWMHFQVMKITEIFVVVVLFGAGTDYCLFLIARYREELEQGRERADAVRLAVRHVGGALVASAATVVCGLGMMVFAEFAKFRYTGPAVALSLAVALVGSLTLTPALLRLLGPFAFWPLTIRPTERPVGAGDGSPRAGTTFQRRFWESLSQRIVRRPLAIWATSVAVLLPFAVWGTRLVPTYDFLAELGDQTDSKLGAALMQRTVQAQPHFPKGTLGRLTVLLEAPASAAVDLRAAEARRDIKAITQAIATGQLAINGETKAYYAPELVATVLSLTSPLGEPIADEIEKPVQAEAKQAKPSGRLAQLFNAASQAAKSVGESAERTRRKNELAYYVSSAADGRVTRLHVVFNVDPFSRESLELRGKLEQLVSDFTGQPGMMLSDATHSFAGTTSTIADLKRITQSDQRKINCLAVVAIYMVLVSLLRQPAICLYLMATVLFGYFATLGMTEGFFRALHTWAHADEPWLGLDWKVSFFLFIILVAVGEDYNILLMSRVVEEEEKRGPIDGVRTALARTGGIITSCGIIMAGTFGSMATGTLAAIIQLGFALGLGVLLDTFVVRPILVPTFLLMFRTRRRSRQDKALPAAPHLSKLPEHPVETAIP